VKPGRTGPRAFTGDTMTSFSFGCLQQHLAMLLDFFGREESNLSGECYFLP